MIEHKKQIALYLSGFADTKMEQQTENVLLRDADFLESFIDTVEQHLSIVPSNFAGSVMRLLPNNCNAAIELPVLSRRLCAAVCFCSAATIILFAVFGFDRHIIEFINEQSGKLGEWIVFAENLH